ncbi:unnamed protein product [Agarophyton chilense]|eukprot:gb/GEZJ01002501.1/.p2 GENE.gb/GEZJ01002501.1/~~gb/GEZJ01002501.1/.p2  ORF type:complete len:591 (-),score=106.96 gb/GEZJ01002501.1/:1912-3684(-)
MSPLLFLPRAIPHTIQLTLRATVHWLSRMTAQRPPPPKRPPPKHPVAANDKMHENANNDDATGKSAAGLDGDGAFTELVEGDAKALYRKPNVFYNPAQVVNRDLSVLLLRWLTRQPPFEVAGQPQRQLRVLEALSATGLRSVRYFKEVSHIQNVIANDLDQTAVQTIAINVHHNGLTTDQVTPSHADAVSLMAASRERHKQFDVVDLDPYGSAAPFLESAVQSVSHGGLLAVTCTDLAVLCGNSPEICFARYSSTPLKGAAAHEMAVRIVLAAIQTAANRHGKAVVPVLCVKIDFYVRLFVRVMESRQLAQQTASSMSLVLQCSDCGTHRFQPLGRVRHVTSDSKKRRLANDATVTNPPQPSQSHTHLKFSPPLASSHLSHKCSICDGSVLVGGPIWNGALIGDGVSESLLAEIHSGVGKFKARERVSAIVRLLYEEVPTPLFLHLPSMCKALQISPPPAAAVRHFLVSKGFKVSQSHTDPQAVKTDADPQFVWDILRVWADKVGNAAKKRKVEGDRPSVAQRILRKPVNLIDPEEIDFSIKRDKFVRRGQTTDKGVRFPLNPEPNWGPKARAGKRKKEDNEQLDIQNNN